MNNLKQNLLLVGVLGILAVSLYGTFFQDRVTDLSQASLSAFAINFDSGYHAGVVNTTSSVGVVPVQVLADGRASLNEVVANLSSSVVFCYEQATTTGAVANAGFPITQYGSLGNGRSAPYYGGIACVTASGTSTVSVTYK